MNRSDITRKAYLAAVLERMRDAEEDARIRRAARELLHRKVANGQIGRSHAERWQRLLGLSRDELAARLLGDGNEAGEMRHAHLFAGALPAREMNRIRRAALNEAGA